MFLIHTLAVSFLLLRFQTAESIHPSINNKAAIENLLRSTNTEEYPKLSKRPSSDATTTQMKDTFSEKRATTTTTTTSTTKRQDGGENDHNDDELMMKHVDPKYTAVLVIDMLNDFLKPGGAMVLEGGEVLYKPIEALTTNARKLDLPIFWLNQNLRSDDKLFETRVKHCLIGSWGANIVNDLTYMADKDIIIPKRRYSGFFQTDLDLHLRQRAIQHLIVTGVVTNICVRSTINDAFFLGYNVIVPKDCVMATSIQSQECHLYDIETHYGKVIESQSDLIMNMMMIQQQQPDNHRVDDIAAAAAAAMTTSGEDSLSESVAAGTTSYVIAPNYSNSPKQEEKTTTITSTSTAQQSKKKKQRIGIICGSGPEAGIDMFAKILKLHRHKLGQGKYKTDKDAPNILMLQVSAIGGPRTQNDLIKGTNDCQQTWNDLRQAIIELAPQVDCFCICCHQLHFFENDIINLLHSRGEPSKKFVSFVQVTMDYLLNQSSNDDCIGDDASSDDRKIAILGGPITTELLIGDNPRSPYKQLATVMPPNSLLQLADKERNKLLDIIRAVKENGVQEDTKKEFKTMLQNLQTNDNVGIAILACTELPLLVTGDDSSTNNNNDDTNSNGKLQLQEKKIQLIDPTEVVAIEMLDRTQQYC